MTPQSESARSYSELRFLVADDKPFIRTLVNSMLLRAGVRQIAHAASGTEAMRHLQKAGARTDCVISDWNMEPTNGLELLQKIRAGEVPNTSPELCFVLLTGTANAAIVNAAIALDVHAYVVKPVSYEKLTKAIGQALERRMTFKGPKSYLAVPGLELPKESRKAAERGPAWILGFSKSPREMRAEAHVPGGATLSPVSSEPAFVATKKMLLTEVTPGAILAEDIHGPEGQLLLSVGTVLKENVLARLAELASGRAEAMKLLIGIVK